jgi:hypothetical protein
MILEALPEPPESKISHLLNGVYEITYLKI